MPQLALFEGAHLPRTAAREALSRGDLHEAREQLERLAGDSEEAADAARLARIGAVLRTQGELSAKAVHEVFASALAGSQPRGFLSKDEWFALYARRLAAALEREPAHPFRGWLGAHFAFAAHEPDAARRALAHIALAEPPGPAWLAAARLAFALGEDRKAREWISLACLDGPIAASDLVAASPPLERCGVPALDAEPALPAFPAPVEDLFETVRTLDLPEPWSRWVAVVGEIDRVLALPGSENAAALDEPEHDGDEARAFLAALRAARRSRERDRHRASDGCSNRELRARRRMQRLSPVLLERYLRGLDGALL